MKLSKLSLALKTAALVGSAALLLTGCLTKSEDSSFKSDGQSAYMTSEIDQMGQIYTGPSVGAKTSGLGLTITGEIVIQPFSFVEACSCFVRNAKYDNSKGNERIRVDTVTLLDASGAKMSVFQPALIAKIIHTRDVTLSKGDKGDKDANIHLDLTIEIKTQDGVKVGVWNGTMAGNYNSQAFKSGTITNITRVWANGHFGFPISGTAELDRPVLHFLMEFLGDGKAKFTITNKVNHKIHILFVDKDYNESDPVEKP